MKSDSCESNNLKYLTSYLVMKAELENFLPRTIYDLQLKRINNLRSNDNKFMKKIAEKSKSLENSEAQTLNNIETSMDKFAYLHENFQKIYDLKLIPVNHLSYSKSIYERNLNDVSMPNTVPAVNFSIEKEGEISEKKENIVYILRNKKFNFYDFGGSKKSDLSLVDLKKRKTDVLESNKLLKLSEQITKEKITLTKTEVFIRNFVDKEEFLLKEIQQKKSESLKKLWLNGKVIWFQDE